MGSQAQFLQLSQVRESRHFGRDAEIQAMDGKKSVVQMLDLGNVPTLSFMLAVQGHLSRPPVCHPSTVTFRLRKCLTQVMCQPKVSRPCDWIPASRPE